MTDRVLLIEIFLENRSRDRGNAVAGVSMLNDDDNGDFRLFDGRKCGKNRIVRSGGHLCGTGFSGNRERDVSKRSGSGTIFCDVKHTVNDRIQRTLTDIQF